MTLARALAQFPSDRESEALVRDLLRAFKSHEGVALDTRQLSRILDVPAYRLEPVLEVLALQFVLDCDPVSPSSYRYRPDSILRREVDAFLRRAESHSGMLQANVAKFRQRYNMR